MCEKIAGENPEPIDYGNIQVAHVANPEIASVGMTEDAAKDAGYELKIGKFPFTASGKLLQQDIRMVLLKLFF